MELTSDLIKEYIKDNKEKYNKVSERIRLYNGALPILNKKDKFKDGTNNIIPVNYHKSIVDINTGFLYGAEVTAELRNMEKNVELWEDIKLTNNFQTLLTRVGKSALISGKSYVLCYQDSNSQTKITLLDSREVIDIYETSTNELQYRIRYFELDNIDTGKKELYVEIYDNKHIYYYIENKDKELILDYSRQNPISHKMNRIPIIKLKNNEEEKGETEQIDSLIDTYSKLISLTADEFENLRYNYLTLKNFITNDESIEKFKSDRLILLDSDGEVNFLNKEINTQSLELLLNRIVEEIHKQSHTPDFSDDNFSGNSSGVALKYKVQNLKTKCIEKERFIADFIKEIILCLKPIIEIQTEEKLEITEENLYINVEENIPIDYLENETINKTKTESLVALYKLNIITIDEVRNNLLEEYGLHLKLEE